MGHSSSTSDAKLRSFVDALLEEQGSLTAVDRFSAAIARCEFPTRQREYRSLLPATPPAAGQQYAFDVDLDKCSGCKACVTACHSLNGLDDEETWRGVGLLYSPDWREPLQQTVTTACHHCVDPECLTGCPVLAYEKDPVTGIVHHLDDQCIGCQYCVMKCPYEVPQYSKDRGIVRKCDMCSSRLAVGEAPACVQACPHEAIRITLVDQRETAAAYRSGPAEADSFLPASPPPELTVPTTRYRSKKPLPRNLLAGDHARVTPAPSHWPLVLMLVLSQLAVGAQVAAIFSSSAKWLTMVSVLCAGAAVAVGTLHLGHPAKAWRAFLGWRTSWFSREVIAFGAFLPMAMLAAITSETPVIVAASIAGLVGVTCSAMIYADTHRDFWSAPRSFGKFFGTMAVLGSAVALAFAPDAARTGLAMVLAMATLVKLAVENRIFVHLVDEETEAPTPLNRSAWLLDGELGRIGRVRVTLALLGGLCLPIVLIAGAFGHWLALLVLLVCVSGELLERLLFFRACAPARMPGGVAG